MTSNIALKGQLMLDIRAKFNDKTLFLRFKAFEQCLYRS